MRKVKSISYRILIFVIFLVATLAFSGSVSAIELAYDDGICGEVYPAIHTTQKLRQRFLLSDFNLSGDYQVEKVRVYWGSSYNFSGVIKLRDYDNLELVVTKSFTNPPQYVWQDYDVSGLSFKSNHFYVELVMTCTPQEFAYICADTNEPNHRRSEVDPGDGQWHVWEGYDFVIRVDVRERPLGALPVGQCTNLVEKGTEKLSMSVKNDFDGCITEASVIFYKGLNCTGEVKLHSFEDNPDPYLVYKSGTRGGCAEAVEVTSSSPACVELTLKSGRKTTVCYP